MSAQPTTEPTFAPAPAERRGLARDAVRLLVADGTSGTDRIRHRTFRGLAAELRAGDVVVVNDSATVPAQLDAHSDRQGPVVLHLATRLDDGHRVVEVRRAPDAARAVLDARPGDLLTVPGSDLRVRLLAPYPDGASSPTGRGNRLWRAEATGDLADTLLRVGRPISYGYLERPFEMHDYQTLFSRRPGSAEMPSAGRPFTPAVVADLVASGIVTATITLHTGVSSQEAGEGPQPERFAVPEVTAAVVNATRRSGGRVVAVGTTVTRALESAVRHRDGSPTVHPSAGWTDRVVTPAEPPQVVTGLVTGWHDAGASHLQLVRAVAGDELTDRAYAAARASGYLWHEFGDAALFLPALGPG
ncbi:S-adenosylmethionine:tRNA ribosyltransferase-isomerase [Nocardioides sambongensis]|uniref:S-adenosylmethionine:tRNA ribosyltransferase-isomerase n=1 Tax=Nocardioides sambongensis TaxID=2589074 RepID=UPI0011273C20|nr:S-adenosylmethionine:tRNA ribosyltransferase-isomerase [Nocardioides sambongensis]